MMVFKGEKKNLKDISNKKLHIATWWPETEKLLLQLHYILKKKKHISNVIIQ